MPKLSEEAMQSRRDAILDASIRCFVAKGFALATVDDICSEAGISKGAFYTHFESKDEAVRGVAGRRSNTIGPLDARSLRSLEDSIFEALVKPAMSGAGSRFELEAMAATASDPALRTIILGNVALIEENLLDALRRLSDNGGVKLRCAPELASSIIHSFVMGLITWQAAGAPDELLDRRQLLRVQLEGLCLDPTPSGQPAEG